MPFTIGTQNAYIANNVEGDQTIHGGQSVVVGVAEARRAAEQLRDAVTALPLPAGSAGTARREAADAAAELQQQTPDRNVVLRCLQRLVEVLRPAGALVAQAATLAGPLGVLAAWLGQQGAALIGGLG